MHLLVATVPWAVLAGGLCVYVRVFACVCVVCVCVGGARSVKATSNTWEMTHAPITVIVVAQF